MTFDEIRQIALSFPQVEEYIVFGSPSFRIRKRFLLSVAKIDPDTLCLKMPNRLNREYLIETKPEIYYNTDHYENFDSILIRMSKVDANEFREFFEDAWLMYAPKKLVQTYQQNHK